MGVQQAGELLGGQAGTVVGLGSDGGRRLQHQRVEAVGVLHREPEGERAAERGPHQVDAIEAQGGDCSSHAERELRHGA
jgi:hypothetical protein